MTLFAAVCLRVSHDYELSVTPQGVKVIGHLCHVELLSIVEDHCSRNVETGDDIFPNKFSYLGRDNRGDSLSFYLLHEVVYHDKKAFALTRAVGKGPSMTMP